MYSLKEIRNKRGMTQQELAQKMDLPQSRISEYENGKHMPGINRAFQLAELLKCTVTFNQQKGLAFTPIT